MVNPSWGEITTIRAHSVTHQTLTEGYHVPGTEDRHLDEWDDCVLKEGCAAAGREGPSEEKVALARPVKVKGAEGKER